MDYDLRLLAYRVTLDEEGRVSIERQATGEESRMLWESRDPDGETLKQIALAILRDFQDERWAQRLQLDFTETFLQAFPGERTEIVVEPGDLQGWLEDRGINLKSVPVPSPDENEGSARWN